MSVKKLPDASCPPGCVDGTSVETGGGVPTATSDNNPHRTQAATPPKTMRFSKMLRLIGVFAAFFIAGDIIETDSQLQLIRNFSEKPELQHRRFGHALPRPGGIPDQFDLGFGDLRNRVDFVFD